MRYCGNCEYSYKAEDFDNIEDDYIFQENVPVIGSCCLSSTPGDEGYCKSHVYIEGIEQYDNFVMYDDQYFGPGYIIISKLNNEIVKFIKISLYGQMGFGNLVIRGYEKNKEDNPDNVFTEINFKVQENEPLYKTLVDLALKLNGISIYSSDPSVEGKNHLQVTIDNTGAKLSLRKDIYGIKTGTKYINIFLGDNYSCPQYFEMLSFYNALSMESKGILPEEDVIKLIKKQ